MDEVTKTESEVAEHSGPTWKPAKVVLVSLAFPPRLDAEALQVSKLHKYLSILPSTEVHVVTSVETKNPVRLIRPAARRTSGITRFDLYENRYIDRALLQFAPGMASRPDLKRHALMSQKVISESLPWRPDVILSRSYPVSSALLAQALADEHKLPWIMQLSDPWTLSPLHPKGYSEEWNDKSERSAFSRASIITFTSLRTMQRYADRFPQLESRFRYFPNTYDPEEMLPNPWSKKQKIRLVYAGTLGGTRVPNSLLDALRHLYMRCPEIEHDVEIVIAGHASREVRKYLSGQSAHVKYLGPISFKESLEVMRSADLLILIDNEVPKNQNIVKQPYEFFPSKILDYMLANRPVLAITPHCSLAAGIVEQYGLGESYGHNDLVGIANALEAYWCKWHEGDGATFNRKAAADIFDARKGAARLRQEMESVINEN